MYAKDIKHLFRNYEEVMLKRFGLRLEKLDSTG